MVELTNTQSTIRRSLQNLVEDSLGQQQQQQQQILRTESSIDTTASGSELDLGSNTDQQQQQIEAQINDSKPQQQFAKVIDNYRLPNKSEDNLSILDDSGTTSASNPTDYYSTTTTTTGHLFLTTSSSTNYLSDTTASETQKSFASVRDLNETELNFELFNSSLNDLTSESKQSETAEKISTPAVVTSSASEYIVLSQQEHIGAADVITRSSSSSQAAAADHHQSLHNQKDHENFLLSSSSSSSIGEPESEITNNKLGYRLRALSENISAWETNPWFRAPTLPPNNINVSPLSTELVNETLNYFVNCGQRLSQMTKTYDDNDAYILLLQEKEVDLELAARIGQDLLRQNKELKESIKNLEDELSKRQGDVQQLKHELASKISLLDTFIEEEEQQNQTSLAENEDDSTLRQHDLLNNNNRPSTSNSQQPKYLSSLPATPDNNNDDEGPSGFLSLNFNYPKPDNSFVEPFSSLPPYPLGEQQQQQHHHHHNNHNHQQVLHGNDSSSTISEDLNSCSKAQEQQKLVQSVTFQLVESNKRLCELQDELFYKSEQNLMQQEKIFNLQEQLKEADRRLGDVAAENELLQKSIMESTGSQKELSDELKVCKRNFSDLLSVFLELQKESRIYRNSTMLQNSNLNYIGEIDPVNDMNNISFDSFKRKSFDDDDQATATNHATPETTHHATIDTYATTKNNTTTTNNNNNTTTTTSIDHNELSSKPNNNVYTQGRIRNDKNGKNKANSLSLLDELQETMQRTGLGGVRVSMTTSSGSEGDCDSDGQGDATDGGDSGVHTNINASSSTTPSADALVDHDSSEDSGPPTKHPANDSANNNSNNSNNNKTWLGFSSFMLTTLLLLCLSVTFTSSPNFPLTPKLKIKLDR